MNNATKTTSDDTSEIEQNKCAPLGLGLTLSDDDDDPESGMLLGCALIIAGILACAALVATLWLWW